MLHVHGCGRAMYDDHDDHDYDDDHYDHDDDHYDHDDGRTDHDNHHPTWILEPEHGCCRSDHKHDIDNCRTIDNRCCIDYSRASPTSITSAAESPGARQEYDKHHDATAKEEAVTCSERAA